MWERKVSPGEQEQEGQVGKEGPQPKSHEHVMLTKPISWDSIPWPQHIPLARLSNAC